MNRLIRTLRKAREADPLSKEKAYELNESASKIKDEDMRNGIYDALNQGKINANNYDKCMDNIQKIINEEKGEKNG